jgi:aspartate/methionine/tyrosine aminotransferase
MVRLKPDATPNRSHGTRWSLPGPPIYADAVPRSALHAQSSRLAAVQTPVIPVVGRWIAETPGTISLGQGVVSYGPPQEAIDAARRFGGALTDHRYGPVEGLPALVDAVERKLAQENGIRVRGSSRVVVTAGGNLAFVNAVLAVTDPGDEVILPSPYYFNHEMAIAIAGGRAVPVPTFPDYQLDVQAIADAITPLTRAVVTVSPNNPTGAMYSAEALRAVNALCGDRGIFHIHDEAYEYFTYDGAPHVSPGAFDGASGHTISLYSLSKAYGFASWRIGYMVIPDALWDAVNKVQDTLLICPPAISQHAAIGALQIGRGYTDGYLSELDGLRHLIFEALGDPDVPCDVPPADGAFYYLVRVHSTLDPLVLTERLIRNHRVAVIPGSAFGDTAGCSIRISYGALRPESVTEGVGRLVSGLKEECGKTNG